MLVLMLFLFLCKASSTQHDTEWFDALPGWSLAGQTGPTARAPPGEYSLFVLLLLCCRCSNIITAHNSSAAYLEN